MYMKHPHIHEGNELSGELLVTGKNEAIINIVRDPERVHVHFVGDPEIVPCNPVHTDWLEWRVCEIERHHKKDFVLIINWGVTGVRKIFWHVHF